MNWQQHLTTIRFKYNPVYPHSDSSVETITLRKCYISICFSTKRGLHANKMKKRLVLVTRVYRDIGPFQASRQLSDKELALKNIYIYKNVHLSCAQKEEARQSQRKKKIKKKEVKERRK